MEEITNTPSFDLSRYAQAYVAEQMERVGANDAWPHRNRLVEYVASSREFIMAVTMAYNDGYADSSRDARQREETVKQVMSLPKRQACEVFEQHIHINGQNIIPRQSGAFRINLNEAE